MKIWDKLQGYLPARSDNNDEASVSSSFEKFSPFDKFEEEKLTKDFEDYISERQDEASGEDYWRVTLAKKTTRIEQEMEKRFDSLEKKMEKRLDSMKKEMKKEMKEDMESLKQMLQVLIDQGNHKAQL